MSLRRLIVFVSILGLLYISCRKDHDIRTPVNLAPPIIDTIPGDTVPTKPPASLTHVLTARYDSISNDILGYYEALPPAYDSTTTNYPLLVFLHGGGEEGNGKEDLHLVLKNAVPKMIDEKTFPVKFTVNGEDFTFIVICPQFKLRPVLVQDVQEDVQAMINYAKAHYRVDASRVYLSGLSVGGGMTWEYAAKYGKTLAAMVPISGASWGNEELARNIALNNVPAWAFHNEDDKVVIVQSTTRYVDMINALKPDPLVRLTLWPTGGHDAWTKATDPNYKEEGKNIYEWMLQFKRPQE